MSLLIQASLVLTPNAYKAETLYSIIPSNGNGDMTVARGTNATRVNSSGVIETVGTTIPRLNYETVGGCPSILLEPQRTNLLLNSDNFGNIYWNKIGLTTITDNTTISPDGTLTADTLNNASGSLVWDSGNTLQRDVSGILTLTTYTFSVFVKSLNGTTFSIGLRNQSTGTIVSANIIPNSEWQRITVSQTTTVNTSIGLLFGNTNGNVAIWGAQLEVGAYATSYIPTVASTVTRNADNITRNNIYTNGLITSAGGTWFIELNNNFSLTRDAASNGIFLADSISVNNGFRIRVTAPNRFVIEKVISITNTQLYITLTDTVKIAIKWNGATADVYVNGTKVVPSTTFTFTSMELLSLNAADVPKYIKSTMLFPTPLTDTECANLTTL